MKNVIRKILLYTLCFLIYSKLYFGIYEYVTYEWFSVSLEFLVVSDIILIAVFIPTAAVGTILISKGLKWLTSDMEN